MSSYEQQASQSSAGFDKIRTEFDRAYLTDPEFRAGIDTAWYRYEDKCAQANTGDNRTIGETLGEYQQKHGQLIADHPSRQPEAERNPTKNSGVQTNAS